MLMNGHKLAAWFYVCSVASLSGVLGSRRNVETWRRGWQGPTSLCEVVGGGPTPHAPSRARAVWAEETPGSSGAQIYVQKGKVFEEIKKGKRKSRIFLIFNLL